MAWHPGNVCGLLEHPKSLHRSRDAPAVFNFAEFFGITGCPARCARFIFPLSDSEERID
jgi:hypothetical protein